MNIGIIIRNTRKKKNIKQIELSQMSGISQTYLSQIENGSRIATIETLENICKALDVPLPVLSFLAIDSALISQTKRDEFIKIEATIKSMIEEVFF